MKRTLLILILSISILNALHIYEDTVWDRRGNPYIFEENVYVHSNATLTILPGCEIHIKAMPSTGYTNFRVNNSGEADAKIFHVTGKIVAIGTEEEPIMFTRYPDTEGYAWGGIFILEGAEAPVFKHCEFYSAYQNIYPDGLDTVGAICVDNGDPRIEYCSFTNCQTGITYNNHQNDTMIYSCTFEATEEAQFVYNSCYLGIIAIGISDTEIRPQLIVARCRFINISFPFGSGSYQGGELINQRVFNYHNKYEDYDLVLPEEEDSQRNQSFRCVYGGVFINWSACGGGGYPDNMSYSRKNYIYDSSTGNPMTTSCTDYHVISDNFFYGNVDIDDDNADSTIVCNNVVYTSSNWFFYESDNPFRVYIIICLQAIRNCSQLTRASCTITRFIRATIAASRRCITISMFTIISCVRQKKLWERVARKQFSATIS